MWGLGIHVGKGYGFIGDWNFFGNFLPILGDIIENILINHNPFINGLLTPFRPYTLI